MQKIFWNTLIKLADGIDSQQILFIHCWKAAIVCKTSIPFHFNDNSIAMFPFPSFSIKKTPLCKRIEDEDYSFQKKNAKGLGDLQNLSMVFSWNIIDFIEISFLFDMAISFGVLRCRFLIVSNAPFCVGILANSNFSSSLIQKLRRKSLSGSKNWHLHQMKSAI